MILKLLTLVALVAVASCRVWGPSARYYRNGMRVASSEFSIEIPPQETRNSEKCEFFEDIDYMEQGCEQYCTATGYFGNVRIQDANSRRLSTCKAEGSYCRVAILTHSELNVTYSNGRCNSDCQCEPYKEEDEAIRNIKNFVGSLLSSRHHSRHSHHRVHSGENQFGVIKLRIPASSERNQTACEVYEYEYYPTMYSSTSTDCRSMCTLRGDLGGLHFEGAPRVVDNNRTEGSSCELHSSSGDDKILVSGVDRIIQGECHKGVCRPVGWKEPEEVKPMLTLTPAQNANVQYKSIVINQGKDTIVENSIDTSESSSSSQELV